MAPCGMPVQRVAGHIESHVVGQFDRQILFRNRHHAADFAMDDRDRATPVTLAGNAPVAQAEIDLALGLRRVAQHLSRELLHDRLKSVRRIHAVQEAGIDHHAIIGEGGVFDGEACGIRTFRCDDGDDRQAVFAGEIQIALVAGGAAEDRAGAIVHQYEVGDIDRQFPCRVQRVHDLDAGIDTLLFRRFQRCQGGAMAAAFVAELGNRRILRRQFPRQRMVGGDRQEGCAEQRVRARRIDGDVGEIFRRRVSNGLPAQRQPLGTTDPVFLHQAHFFRPLIQRIQLVQQVLAEIGDAEEPLRQFALFHQRAGAPAAAVDHLLIGQHGVVDRIPVDLGLLAIDQTFFHEIDEQRLLAMVIFHVTGGEFAGPVQRQAHGFQLAAHGRDVLVGPVLRMNLVLHGGIFGRHAEGVPAHRMQDVETTGTLVAGDDVAHGVVADMAHMDASRWIRKHL
ncbi:hypothetical protein D3C78_1017200 [compost metagenome]